MSPARGSRPRAATVRRAAGPRPRRPLIGVAAWLERAAWSGFTGEVALAEREFIDKLRTAGADVVLIPPDAGAATRMAGLLDGLVLAGGHDVDAALYGAAPHPSTDPPHVERDAGELALVVAALERGLPLLAVCRGCQLMNVACGGTLVQHLPERAETLEHGAPRDRRPFAFVHHAVLLSADDPLAGVLGERFEVPSSHHQAIERVGDGLVPIGWAEDGVIEAVRLPTADFVVGVQWHPEADEDSAIFDALVRAARGRVSR